MKEWIVSKSTYNKCKIEKQFFVKLLYASLSKNLYNKIKRVKTIKVNQPLKKYLQKKRKEKKIMLKSKRIVILKIQIR